MERLSLIAKTCLLIFTWLICVGTFAAQYPLWAGLSILGLALTISISFFFDLKSTIVSFSNLKLDQSRPLNTKGILNTEFLDAANRMNEIINDLKGQTNTLTQEISEHDAIFSSMAEGVLAFSQIGQIKFANASAIKILDTPLASLNGRSIEECVRNANLQESLKSALNFPSTKEVEFPLYDQKERWLKVQTSPLRNPEGLQVGTLAILNDITRVKELESLRRDFVANVSHELRTPLTSIHGFAETLLKTPNLSKEQIQQFIEVIYKHSGRLSGLIEDLLSLSQIERNEDSNSIELNLQSLSPIIKSAMEITAPQAKAINAKVSFNCQNDICVYINAPLLEQAVINLLENAIKYSGPNSLIDVSVKTQQAWAVISVTDNGPGISTDHLPRIFERFYRIDRSRSRKMGGTGLGLAIVKHIAQSHHGRVEVTSELKKGSTFSVFIPLTQNA